MYEGIEFDRLFDNQSESGKRYNLGAFYESRINEAIETVLGEISK